MPAEMVLQACGADLRQKALPAVCADHYIFITALRFVFLIIRPTKLANGFFLLFFSDRSARLRSPVIPIMNHPALAC